MKSWNKFSMFKDPLEENLRLRRAEHEDPSLGAPQSVDTRPFSSRVWRARSQVCDSLAQAAEDKLSELDPALHISRLGLGGLHAVTLVGLLPDGMLGKSMREWPSDIAICDPWANIACPANQYPDRFRSKMAQWHDNGKLIFFRSQWRSPLDPEWLGLVDGQRMLLVRSERPDGAVVFADQHWHAGPAGVAEASSASMSFHPQYFLTL
ncbi:MAG TPA: hypothetical protein VIM12_17900 [Noviherbaspirillum sp.]|uniref:hypothetical protein n=1 Tax=Noviherbaspirillum sp. TaxID=1926288 RepID=UPI002F941ADF